MLTTTLIESTSTWYLQHDEDFLLKHNEPHPNNLNNDVLVLSHILEVNQDNLH